MQESIVTSRGFDVALTDVLRTAHHWYPDEPLFKEIPIHVKYNRARLGDLAVGVVAPNPKLWDLWAKKKARLYGRKKKQKGNGLTVVLAGSYS